MSDRQFRRLLAFAAGYLSAQMVMWLGYGLYLWVTGRM